MSIVDEIWKDVVDFEGFYQVSNLGRVRSVDRVVVSSSAKRAYSSCRRGRIIQGGMNPDGYRTVNLSRSPFTSKFTVHSLVAQAFIGDRPQGFHVNHIDGCKTNNSASNLEYCSHKDNINHAVSIGLWDGMIAENHCLAKLRDSDIPIIRSRLSAGDTYKQIAVDYGVAGHTIACITKGLTWKSIPDDALSPCSPRKRVGADHHGSKLRDSDIPVIRDRIASGHVLKAIAKDYGVDPATILNIKLGKIWKHVK